MKKTHSLALILAASFVAPAAFAEKKVDNEYLDWRLISVSHRTDKKTLRAILGNDVAIKAARANKVTPWPDGTMIAKVVWKERAHPNWAAAIVPAEFAAAEAMIKDSKKYAKTGGWGFGHWVKGKLEMHSAETTKTCFSCHSPMKANDYVYTLLPAMTVK
ncbi:MAG: cytochrome P460 family protein [Methylococcales bacterium]|nr:cytochrome P460 family protein [Methylococcales bacterium]